MFDVEIHLAHQPGELARVGEAVAGAGISIEGGGAWVCGGIAVGHFLFKDGDAARQALQAAGIKVVSVSEVTLLRLAQGTPGQLGLLCRKMADAGVNIAVQYSDHDNQLVLVTDDPARSRVVAEAWRRSAGSRG